MVFEYPVVQLRVLAGEMPVLRLSDIDRVFSGGTAYGFDVPLSFQPV
jgi:hypothetical protein